MSEKLLTKEIAQRFVVSPSSVDLSEYTELDDDAVAILSNGAFELALDGLQDISDPAAAILAKFEGRVSLEGLTSLSGSPGHVRLKIRLGWSLSYMEAMPRETAQYLDAQTSLSDLEARSLSTFGGEMLSLNGLVNLSDRAAGSLSTFGGSLSLASLRRLPFNLFMSGPGHIQLAQKLLQQGETCKSCGCQRDFSGTARTNYDPDLQQAMSELRAQGGASRTNYRPDAQVEDPGGCGCDAFVCDGCTLECGCGAEFCEDCVRNNASECAACGAIACDTCMWERSRSMSVCECGKIVCEDCGATCYGCERVWCDECEQKLPLPSRTEWCSLCGNRVCESCRSGFDLRNEVLTMTIVCFDCVESIPQCDECGNTEPPYVACGGCGREVCNGCLLSSERCLGCCENSVEEQVEGYDWDWGGTFVSGTDDPPVND